MQKPLLEQQYIEVPVSKERVPRNEEKELATDISNPQNANLDENKDEAPDLTGAERELGLQSCTIENRDIPEDAKKTDQQMTAQLKNGTLYYPVLLRVKIVREIERQLSDNIEILEAIIDASKNNNVDPEIATVWWKSRKKYFELDEKRKTKPKALNPDDGLASINEKKGLEKSSEEIFAGENNENSDKLESKREIVETIPMKESEVEEDIMETKVVEEEIGEAKVVEEESNEVEKVKAVEEVIIETSVEEKYISPALEDTLEASETILDNDLRSKQENLPSDDNITEEEGKHLVENSVSKKGRGEDIKDDREEVSKDRRGGDFEDVRGEGRGGEIERGGGGGRGRGRNKCGACPGCNRAQDCDSCR